jgi:hypothetical protein
MNEGNFYNSEEIIQDNQETQEIFQSCKLSTWENSEFFYKGIIVSLLVHALMVALISQVDLFGSKACDSPYVGKVCQVIETVYVTTKLLETETEFSSREYEKTELKEDLDVELIDVTDRFTYPPGYFALANEISNEINGESISQETKPLDITQPQTLPTPNPNPVIGNLPKPPAFKNFPKRQRNRPSIDASKNQNIPAETQANIETSKNPTLNQNANINANTNQKIEQILNQVNNSNQVSQENNLEENKLFNKKPLEDFGTKYGEAILNKEYDLNAPFEIEVKANLNEFGKLVNVTYSAKPGSDAKMIEIAKEAISAFSDSQILRTLYDVGIRSVNIVFSQDKEELKVLISSDAGTPNRASSIKSSTSLILKGALSNMKPESDEAKLISKAEISTQGKLFVVNFKIPHNEKMELIEKNLRSLQEKQKKPSSDISSRNILNREG